MRHWHIRSPETETDWQQYYQLRYQVVRAPWQQAPGSERDELEAEAFHLMLFSPHGELAAVGRLHRLADNNAQVRYMAVAEACRGQGAGAKVLAALEQLRRGVRLNDGLTRPARAERIADPQLWPRDPPVRFRKSVPDGWIELTIKEGRNRQVRRMCAAVGLPCLRLVRISVGPHRLEGLPPGQWRQEPG